MKPIAAGTRDSGLGDRARRSVAALPTTGSSARQVDRWRRASRAASDPIPESRVPTTDEARLRKTAGQLEGVFVQQLFKAMRDTVPQDEGAIGAGTGEDMFTGLMDQHLAADTPTQWAHGLAEAAYKQLRAALPTAAQSATPASPASPAAIGAAAPNAIPLTTPAAPAMPLGAPMRLSTDDNR
jgi:peptidoglycan hydrolase FlgJ